MAVVEARYQRIYKLGDLGCVGEEIKKCRPRSGGTEAYSSTGLGWIFS